MKTLHVLLLMFVCSFINSQTSKIGGENLADLVKQDPGSGKVFFLTSNGKVIAGNDLIDGDDLTRVNIPGQSKYLVLQWTVPHVINQVSLFMQEIKKPFLLEGLRYGEWFPIQKSLKVFYEKEKGYYEYLFEPAAFEAVRISLNNSIKNINELKVFAYLPGGKGKNIEWPAKLIHGNLLEKEILAQKDEPSFASLATYALSMPAWAMMGLKDRREEHGVRWNGDIHLYGWNGIFGLHLGNSPRNIKGERNFTTRRLMDGWLPGIIVNKQFGNILVEQISFEVPKRDHKNRSIIFLRLIVTNQGSKSFQDSLHLYGIARQDKELLKFENGALIASKYSKNVLICAQNGYGENTGSVQTQFIRGKRREVPHQARGKRREVDRKATSIIFGLNLKPGQKQHFDLVIPVYPCGIEAIKDLKTFTFENAQADFKAYWKKIINPAMKIQLPEKRLNLIYKSILTQLLINGEGNVMPYGAFPSHYDGDLYGVEEGYVMLALSMSGFYKDAQRYMDGTYLTKGFLGKVEKYKGWKDRHQQYRNGLLIMYAASAYRISRDQQWLKKHLKLLKECAEWTIQQRKKTMLNINGKQPAHWGLLPKWSYGGDIASLQTYALYGNLACWRGLIDTSWMLSSMGDKINSQRYQLEAQKYRTVIEKVIDQIFRPQDKPPFLPFRVYGKKPTAGDYYQLFAGVILDLQPFDFKKPRVNYITDFLEKNNLTFCRLPRFREFAGAGGLDAIYGLGYVRTKLHQDKIREFLLGFYGYLAFNMEHDCHTSRETNFIYASDRHLWTRVEVSDYSDPLPCSSAVVVHLLRHMLITEEFTKARQFSDELLLLFGAPRKWFENGKQIQVSQAPSFFGKMSFQVTSAIKNGFIEAVIKPPTRNKFKGIKIRIRHPDGKKFKKVLMNGQPWQKFDKEKELVLIPGGKKKIQLKVIYR